MTEFAGDRTRLYYDEWTQCRKSVGRFDGYLLGIRTRAFGILTILAGGLLTLERLNLISLEMAENHYLASYLGNFFFLSLVSFLLLSFVLDRYYENLLCASVARSCVLEIKMLNRFGVGLSTGIESLKDKVAKTPGRLERILSRLTESAHVILLVLYLLVFVFVVALHVVFLVHAGDYYMIALASAFWVVYSSIGFFINRSLFRSLRTISFYRSLFSGRILFASEQIESRLREICETIVADHFKGGDQSEIILVPVMQGARSTLAGFLKAMNGILHDPVVRQYPIHIERTIGSHLAPPHLRTFPYDESCFHDRTVIIIDDLTDKGATLALAREKVLEHGARTVITLVAVQKRRSEATMFIPDYCCFSLGYDAAKADKTWLFGFGMDIQEEFRDCDYIAEYDLE